MHAGDDHPARLDLCVEWLEVGALGEAGRGLDVEGGADLVADLLAELDLDSLGAAHEGGVGGHEDRGEEVRRIIRATAHDAADGLAEEQVRALGRRVRGEDQARDVDAFADHVDGDEPARSIGVAAGEALDPGVGLRFVAEHHDRLLTRDRAQQRARRAGVRAVVAQDEPSRVGNDSARFGQECVGVAQHLGQQRGVRVDRRSEAARVVGRVQLVGEGRDRLLGVHAPAQRRVEQPERGDGRRRRGRPRRTRRRSRGRSGALRRS